MKFFWGPEVVFGGIDENILYNSLEIGLQQEYRNSSESLAKKDAAWKKITLEFRAKYPGDVEEKALKGLSKRIKEKAKKDMDQQRLELSGEITKL